MNELVLHDVNRVTDNHCNCKLQIIRVKKIQFQVKIINKHIFKNYEILLIFRY